MKKGIPFAELSVIVNGGEMNPVHQVYHNGTLIFEKGEKNDSKPEQATAIDCRALLAKYIELVLAMEGTDFIKEDMTGLGFTKAESELLNEIADPIVADWRKPR